MSSTGALRAGVGTCLALVVVRGGEVLHGRAVTPDTPFLLGSMSKSFTALAVVQLEEAGLVDLDAPAQRYLPWFRVADPAAASAITVRHLLHHTSGLPTGGGSPGANTLEEQVRALAKVPARPPGQAHGYSSLNYGELQRAWRAWLKSEAKPTGPAVAVAMPLLLAGVVPALSGLSWPQLLSQVPNLGVGLLALLVRGATSGTFRLWRWRPGADRSPAADPSERAGGALELRPGSAPPRPSPGLTLDKGPGGTSRAAARARPPSPALCGPRGRSMKTLSVSCLSLALACLAAGCSSQPAVLGGAEVIDRTTSALVSVGAIRSIEGTFGAGCTERAGPWGLALEAYPLPAGTVALSVVNGDVDCALAVTRVRAGPADAPLAYLPAAPFPLTESYAGLGEAFRLDGSGEARFFANFRIQPDLSFSGDFTVQMVYSDNVTQTNLNVNTTWVESQATATASAVPPPDATLALGGLRVTVGAQNLVQTATGSGTLTQGPVVAESYVLALDTLGDPATYGSIDAAFKASPSRVTLGVGQQDLAAAEFGLIGIDVTTPQVRNVIVANIENGVNSYQLFKVTILGPSGTLTDTTPPTVVSTLPAASATGVAPGAPLSVTFSEAMSPATITSATCRLLEGSTVIAATVTYADKVATIAPTAPLAGGTTYSLTVTTGVQDAAGNALAAAFAASFATLQVAAGPEALDLGTAGEWTILSTAGISAGADAAVVGDIGLTPMGSVGLTGFLLVLDASGTFATSPLLTGKAYASDYSGATPARLATALADSQAAYADGVGRLNPDGLDLGAGELGGLTLVPGLYKWTGAVTVTTDVTLQGGPNDVWVLQIGGAMSMTAAMKVALVGGAQAKNVYWVVNGAVAAGAAATLEGVVLAQGAISTGAGALATGRLLGQAAVTLGATSVVTHP